MTTGDSDKELVKRAKEGDLRAFDMLVLKYQRRVFRLISRLIKNTSEVEDEKCAQPAGHMVGKISLASGLSEAFIWTPSAATRSMTRASSCTKSSRRTPRVVTRGPGRRV